MLYQSTLEIMGCEKPGENPFPIFMDQKRDAVVPVKDSMREEDCVLLGYENGARFLPYKVKSSYDRNRIRREYTTIILENETLRATFLPDYGGRLYSLYHKKMEKELLFKNPVIQPANLAILDAWISGGIEWNMGQYGHAFTTCAPLFTASLTDETGQEFLRMYEYERCRGLFWQMDFHLPEGSEVLELYVRIVNDSESALPVYWWTNIAVPEQEKARVLAGTDNVIYLDMDDLAFGRAKADALPVLPGRDPSYPVNFPFSDEYFFQEQACPEGPWEACIYPEWAFFECSSRELAYRKLFCWGTSEGGNHWKDFLSEPGKGNYVEIQGGLGRTQRHGKRLEAGETLEFVQCFGGFSKTQEEFYEPDRRTAWKAAEARIDTIVPEADRKEMEKRFSEYGKKAPEKILHYGSGFGALEKIRRQVCGEREIPAGFVFPEDSMGREQSFWLKVLGATDIHGDERPDSSYMVSGDWFQLLRGFKAEEKADQLWKCLHLSVMCIERGEYDCAEEWILKSLETEETALAYRNLAYTKICRNGSASDIAALYKKGLALCREDEWQLYLTVELFQYLAGVKDAKSLLAEYKKLPESVKADGRICMMGAKAAIEEGELELAKGAFEREYVNIRENATDLTWMWTEYHRKKELENGGGDLSPEEVIKKYPLPYALDFRMI